MNYVDNSATDDSIAHAMIDIAIVDIPAAWKNLNLTQNELLTMVIGNCRAEQSNITFCGYPAHLIEKDSDDLSNAKISVLLNNDTICVIAASMSFNSENHTKHAVDLIEGITIVQAGDQMLSTLPTKAADSKLQTAINELVALMPETKPASCDECVSASGPRYDKLGKHVQTYYVVCWNGSAFKKLSRLGEKRVDEYIPITLEEIPYDAYIYLISEAYVWSHPSTITKEEFIDVMTRVRGETYYANNDTLVTRVITSDTRRIGHIEDNTPEVKEYAEGIHYYGPLPTCVRKYVA